MCDQQRYNLHHVQLPYFQVELQRKGWKNQKFLHSQQNMHNPCIVFSPVLYFSSYEFVSLKSMCLMCYMLSSHF